MNPVFIAAAALAVSGVADPDGGDRSKPSPPVLLLTADNTEIKQSCTIEIPPGTIISDPDGNGVIHIRTSGITVSFQAGSSLWGGSPPRAGADGPWDRYSGIGIRLDGARDVTIQDARVHGFKVGIWATDSDGLKVHAADLSDNYRQRLKSSPESEDSSDWLYPHRNDNDEWAVQHGAGLYIRGAERAEIRNVVVRRGQNGVLLNRVNRSSIFDNDCSFLSGWGLGMFRSSGNTVSRNSFDFCVRGHSEGRYNRGQDSAGILMFEQCSGNMILENSCTHGGDGIFGFAGLEAVNGEGAPAGFDFKRRGCNDNIFIGNDLSYAPAHGLEMTFSFGNTICGNRFVENAICGIWGGYSQETRIFGNSFIGNGGMAYGLERGGINIEHGANNTITGNEFVNNRCGIHLWWDAHGDFETKAWGRANYIGIVGNVIAQNSLRIDAAQPFGRVHPDRPLVGVQVRDTEPSTHIGRMVFAGNTLDIDPSIGIAKLVPKDVIIETTWDSPLPETPASRALGARPDLRGRGKIIMGEWGPWDHRSPMVRLRTADADSHVFEVFGAGEDLEVSSGLKAAGAEGPLAIATVDSPAPGAGPATPRIVRVMPSIDRNGVFPYRFNIRTRGDEIPIQGMIISSAWQLTTFPWDDASDPRKDLGAWRRLAEGDRAFSIMAGSLNFDYGHGGPKDQKWSGPLKDRAPGPDRFGMIARSRLTLGAGRWRFTTLSDDGVRVLADGRPIIENWTWHAPTKDTGLLELRDEREVELVVEHFEIDGHAVLRLTIEPER